MKEPVDQEAFWMVWNPAGRSPTHRHETEYRAIEEAERLARLNAGQTFYVLEAKCLRKIDEPMLRITLEHPIPF